jgi:hypothetical protein
MSEAASVLAGAPAPTTGTVATDGQGQPAPVAQQTTDTPATIPEWAKDYGADIQGVITAKKWETPAQAVESYKNLEKLLGGDKVALPKEPNDPAWEGVWKRLGAYDKPEEYAAAVKPLNGQAVDPAFVQAMSPLAKKANLTAAQWETLANGYQDFAAKALAAQGPDVDPVVQIEADLATLKSELGPKYDETIAASQRAGKAVGITNDESMALMETLGVKRAVEIMSGLGKKFGVEAPYVSGDGGPVGDMSPEQARVAIKELTNDKAFVAAYTSGDVKAKAKMEALHKLAAGTA